MRSNAQMYADAEADFTREAIRQTDQEIFDEALGINEDENNGDHDLELTEGWDGGELPDEELWERTLNGDEPSGYDRPLEMRREQELESENQTLRQQVAEREARLDEIENGPERHAARQEHFRNALFNSYGILTSDDAGAERLYNTLAAQHASTEALQAERVNGSLAAARERYGADFDQAFRSMTSMDPNNPTARSLVQHVLSSRDPGEAVLQLHNNGMAGLSRLGLAGARTFPTGGGRGGRGGRSHADADDFMDRADVEREIADSVWD